MKCPCYSGLSYEKCCEPCHKNLSLPPNALALMRSRYSAYALGHAEYIIKTTHPENPTFMTNTEIWKQSILEFCNKTTFQNLEIIDFIDGEKEAYVTFFAHLKQDNNDTSFQEKSRFKKVENQWLYHSGNILK